MFGTIPAARRRHAAWRWPWTVLLATALIGAPACGSDSSTGPGQSLAGTYYLTSVANVDPPVKIHHGPHYDGDTFYNQLIVEVVDGDVIFEKNGEFSVWFEFYFYGDEFWVDEMYVEGTYEVNGQEVHLVPYDRDDTWATLQDGAITFSVDLMGYGNVFTYRFER